MNIIFKDAEEWEGAVFSGQKRQRAFSIDDHDDIWILGNLFTRKQVIRKLRKEL